MINDVIMSDADCTPGREPRSVAASIGIFRFSIFQIKERFPCLDSGRSI